MDERVRRLLRDAERLGFKRDGMDGRGHHVLVHENGQRYQIPSTPGDWRGDKNAISDMERISGRKLPRVNRSGGPKFSDHSSGFSLEVARKEAIERRRAEEAERAKQAEAEEKERRRRKHESARERSRREIEDLMRPGWAR